MGDQAIFPFELVDGVSVEDNDELNEISDFVGFLFCLEVAFD